MIERELIKETLEVLRATENKPTAYDTTAEVRRVEGDTLWVHIPGGVDETPVSKTINASPGDNVQIRVAGGRAFVVGNATKPPTDDGTAIIANKNAGNAQKSADKAYSFAATAHAMAKRTDQHFFVDTNGAHVTVGENTPDQGKNLLMTNDGISVRNNTTDLATFTADGAVIGEDDKSHVEITPEETRFYNTNGSTTVGIISNANLSTHAREQRIFYYDNPDGTVLDDIDSTSTTENLAAAPYNLGGGYHLLDVTVQIQGVVYDQDQQGYYADQYNETATFTGYATKTLASMPVTLMYAKVSSDYRVTVSFGDLSGITLQSPRVIVTAFYYDGSPSSKYSFGVGATAAGDYSFAEGYNTRAAGAYSFAGGIGTIANGANQMVIGKYNSANTTDYFQIGNGSSSARSNIFRVMSNGKVNTSRGNLLVGSDVFGSNSENVIPKNANLNNYTTPGNYYCYEGPVAATHINPPFSGLSYQMIVFAYAGQQRVQVAWQNALDSPIKYRIKRSDGTWGAWRRIHAAEDTHPIGEIIYDNKSTSGTTAVPVYDVDNQAGTVVNMTSIIVPAGHWAVTAHASFQASGGTSGYRGVRIGTNAYNEAYGSVQVPANTGGNTSIMTTRYINLTSQTTLYLNVYSANACNANNNQVIEAIRIS